MIVAQESAKPASQPVLLVLASAANGRLDSSNPKTRKERKLYGLRKQTLEPVFGIIKSVMRFRQFLLRGLASVQGEWTLVTMAWNIKRLGGLAG